MKKIFLTIAFIATGLIASAQVGIGNTDPKVSLQVDKSATATEADGVLVPRVSVDDLNTKAATYLAAQNGTLVFVNDLTGTPAGKTIDVTATGFYYYSAGTVNKWVALGGVKASPARIATVGDNLTDADLNGTVIYTGSANGTTFALNTILNPKVGDTVTLSDNAAGTFLVSATGLGTGARTGPAQNGGSVTYVYVGGAWYHTNSF